MLVPQTLKQLTENTDPVKLADMTAKVALGQTMSTESKRNQAKVGATFVAAE